MDKVQLDQADIARRYLLGESLLSLAKSLKVDRRAIEIRLRRAGVSKRSASEQKVIDNSRTSPEERQRRVAAAHEAKRGRPNSDEALARAAITREMQGQFGSPEERVLAALLAARGIHVTPQRAIGPYNADLANGRTAIEVFGGNWHSSGSHAARAPQRFNRFFAEGWNLVILWTQVHNPAGPRAADTIARFAAATTTAAGQYIVITGDGKTVTKSSAPFNPEHIAAINRRQSKTSTEQAHPLCNGGIPES